MYMDLDNILIRHQYNGIPDGFQKALEIRQLLLRKLLFQHNNKLRAVAEFNVRLLLPGRYRLPSRRAFLLRIRNRIVDLFSKESVIGPF